MGGVAGWKESRDGRGRGMEGVAELEGSLKGWAIPAAGRHRFKTVAPRDKRENTAVSRRPVTLCARVTRAREVKLHAVTVAYRETATC
eukprot:COSAG02_NODE_4364_length_5447_cov_19.656694_5_plen_88_part_00